MEDRLCHRTEGVSLIRAIDARFCLLLVDIPPAVVYPEIIFGDDDGLTPIHLLAQRCKSKEDKPNAEVVAIACLRLLLESPFVTGEVRARRENPCSVCAKLLHILNSIPKQYDPA